MSVRNIECQLAQAQIGRYLNGDRFSPEAVVQLEGHIADCSECKALITKRRIAMQGFGQEEVTPAPAPVASSAEVEPAKTGPLRALVDSSLLKGKPDSDSEKRAYWRPLTYSGLLALVLVAMSWVTKDPTVVFGKRLDVEATEAANRKPGVRTVYKTVRDLRIPFVESEPAERIRTQPTIVVSKPMPRISEADPFEARDRDEASAPAPAKREPEAEENSERIAAKAVAPKPALKTRLQSGRSVRRTSWKPRKAGNAIRVYNADGTPRN